MDKRILEALQMQPLSEEEMSSRHILGRLYGPIATCIESTRNGRLYNRPLWENALRDEIFLEKVATKALFLELGHPADREETDMKQACACIPEVPKIVGDDLYAYVDILDTPNGRLLKTLVDYGFVPGISSRGSGDVMDNNQVDPETFFLETWDIVQLPAVKKARLNVCESLDSASMQLRKALAESYKTAKDEDKDTMKKALDNLNIDIKEELEGALEATSEESKILTADDIPWDPSEEEVLVEDTEDTEETAEDVADEASEEIEVETTDDNEDEISVRAETTETEEATEEVEDSEESTPEIDTVGDTIELLQEYDDDMRIEFEPLEIEGEEYEVDHLVHFIDDSDKEDPILVIGVDCEASAEETAEEAENTDEIDNKTDTTDEEISEEDSIEATEDTASADDDGDTEVIESLKEMIRQKEAVETELNSLRKAKTVGDAKVEELQEKLARYRTVFKNLKAEAAKVPELQSNVKVLSEKLEQSNKQIETLTEKVNNARQLKESVITNNAEVKRLNEEVSQLSKKSETLEAKLEGQTKVYTEKLQERTNLAKSYKARFIETLTKYVESKANMLGVKPSEITSRLNENYTLADVDAVCDQILDSTINFGRLPFSGGAKTSARISESVSNPVRTSPEYGYEIDDSLLELAGLKK